MKTYSIEKANQTFIPIDNFPWDETGYHPSSEFLVTRDEKNFFVRFRTKEDFIRNEMTAHNTDIHTDSCVEFFCNYDPAHSEDYINIEINPNGFAKFKIGPDRHHRRFLTEEELDSLHIEAHIDAEKNVWTVSYQIPFAVIQKYYPSFRAESGFCMKGNVYKCGDETKYPHFACWNPIENPTPDFHLSQHFGNFLIK